MISSLRRVDLPGERREAAGQRSRTRALVHRIADDDDDDGNSGTVAHPPRSLDLRQRVAGTEHAADPLAGDQNDERDHDAAAKRE